MFPKLLCGMGFCFLTACESLGLQSSGNADHDFLTYGANIQLAAEDERREIYRAAVTLHQTSPTAASAIQLAIASLSVEEVLPSQEILSLLAFAESTAVNEDVIVFIEFFRPLVTKLVELQATLETESETRQALEAQLEALKELEEQLDAPGGGR